MVDIISVIYLIELRGTSTDRTPGVASMRTLNWFQNSRLISHARNIGSINAWYATVDTPASIIREQCFIYFHENSISKLFVFYHPFFLALFLSLRSWPRNRKSWRQSKNKRRHVIRLSERLSSKTIIVELDRTLWSLYIQLENRNSIRIT